MHVDNNEIITMEIVLEMELDYNSLRFDIIFLLFDSLKNKNAYLSEVDLLRKLILFFSIHGVMKKSQIKLNSYFKM